MNQETIRILFTIAATKEAKVKHLDVKSAFLNGEIQDDQSICSNLKDMSQKQRKIMFLD